MYLFKRRRYGVANLLFPGLVVAVLFAGSGAVIAAALQKKYDEISASVQAVRNGLDSISMSLPSASAVTRAARDAERRIDADPAPMMAPPITRAPTPAAKTTSPTGIPKLDIAAYCKSLGDLAGGSYQLEASCRTQEFTARDDIAQGTVPDRVMKYCSSLIDVSPSYMLLKGCIDQELKAKDSM